MATFISLLNFTDQGIRNIKDSPDRYGAFRAKAERNHQGVLLHRWPSRHGDHPGGNRRGGDYCAPEGGVAGQRPVRDAARLLG